MIDRDIRAGIDRTFCCCVNSTTKGKSLIDDGKPVKKPMRIGSSILLCGKRKTIFPFQCLVGPDWSMVAGVYFMIIITNVVILFIISPIGWPPVFVGGVTGFALFWSYSTVVCSDPGIVYYNDYNAIEDSSVEENILDDSKRNSGSGLMLENIGGSSDNTGPTQRMPSVPDTMECGRCEFRRPYSARHCEYCEVCVSELDHHCPWCGKCIGEKNIKAFYVFLNLICFQIYYLGGCLIYYLITVGKPGLLPVGPHF